MPLIALLATALAADPLPAALPDEPLIGGELRTSWGDEAATLPLTEQHLELEVGVMEARATLTQRFELPAASPERARYALALPAGALLLAASVAVDGQAAGAPELEEGRLHLDLGPLPGGAVVVATVDLALPVRWTGSGSQLELPSAARLAPAAPWLEPEAPENEVQLWFGREVAGLVLDDGRLELEAEPEEPLILEWREYEGAFGLGGFAAMDGATCGYIDYTANPPTPTCAGGQWGHGYGRGGGRGGLGQPRGQDPGCPEQTVDLVPLELERVQQQSALLRLGTGGQAGDVRYDDALARAVGPKAKGVEPPRLGRDLPDANPDDRALVDLRIRRDLHGIQACYRRALLLEPELEGTVTVGFWVREDGLIQGLSILESDLNHPETEACLLEELAWTRFHEPDAPFQVRYPFRFSPAQTAAR